MLKILLKQFLFYYYVFLISINLFIIIYCRDISVIFNVVALLVIFYGFSFEIKKAKRLYLVNNYKNCYIRMNITEVHDFLNIFKYKNKRTPIPDAKFGDYIYATVNEYVPYFTMFQFINPDYKIINFKQILRKNKIEKII